MVNQADLPDCQLLFATVDQLISASNALPESSVSLALGDVIPQIIIQTLHLRVREFESRLAKNFCNNICHKPTSLMPWAVIHKLYIWHLERLGPKRVLRAVEREPKIGFPFHVTDTSRCRACYKVLGVSLVRSLCLMGRLMQTPWLQDLVI